MSCSSAVLILDNYKVVETRSVLFTHLQSAVSYRCTQHSVNQRLRNVVGGLSAFLQSHQSPLHSWWFVLPLGRTIRADFLAQGRTGLASREPPAAEWLCMALLVTIFTSWSQWADYERILCRHAVVSSGYCRFPLFRGSTTVALRSTAFRSHRVRSVVLFQASSSETHSSE